MSDKYLVNGEPVTGIDAALARAKEIQDNTGVIVSVEMARTEVTFTMDLRVFDPAQLLVAAMLHAKKEGDPVDDLIVDGEIDIRACLIQIIDPGSLAGCSIHQSDVTILDDSDEA